MSDLRSTLEQRSRRGTPIGSDQLRERVAMELAGSPRPERFAMHGWVYAVAAAVITLVVIGVTSMLLGGSDGSVVPIAPTESTTPQLRDEESTSLDATTTSLSEATPSTIQETPNTAVETSVGTLVWGSQEVPRALTDISVLDGGFVARSVDEGPSGVHAEAVTSSDGLSWVPLESQPAWAGSFSAEAIQRTGLPYATAFVQHGGGVLSVTAFTTGDLPVVEWLPEPGATWSEVPLEPVAGIGQGDIAFATGAAGAILFAGSAEGDPLLWVLGDDGFELIDDPVINALPVPDRSVPYTDAGLAGYLRAAEFHATDSGFLAEFFVAGETGTITAPPLRFLSTDGREWTEIPGPNMEIWDTAVRDSVTLAVGDGGIRMSSDNGSTWSQPPTTNPQHAGVIVAGPLGWVIPAGQVGVWFVSEGVQLSTDAVTWETILEPNATVTGIAVDTERIVVATSGGWDTTIHQVWVGHVTP